MLNFEGNGTSHTCDGTTRRDFLQTGVLGATGFTLAQHAQAKEQGLVADGNDQRSVIMIFNLGAPSQVEDHAGTGQIEGLPGRYLGYEAGRSCGDSRAVQADSD